MIVDQVLQQLRLNGNASRKCCNSVSDQSVIVVEVQSGSTSTTITTIADKATFYGNVCRRLSPAEKCLQGHRHRIIFCILCNDESNAEFNFNWRAVHGCCSGVPSRPPKIVGCVLRENALNQFVCESLLRQAATHFFIVPVTWDLTVPSTCSVLM